MLSATSEYALRALALMAQLPRERVILGRELASQTGVPPKYLPKIMLALRNAGIVAATRGTGGGYMLLRPADAIHLIDVVVLFEGPSVWPQCLLRPNHECSEKQPCTAHRYWGGVQRGLLEFLERTTLKDVSGNNTHLKRAARAVRGAGGNR